jgi:hypothetical protein
VESKWKNYHITTFLDSLSPKTLSLEEAMDLSRDRNEMNEYQVLLSVHMVTAQRRLTKIPLSVQQSKQERREAVTAMNIPGWSSEI